MHLRLALYIGQATWEPLQCLWSLRAAGVCCISSHTASARLQGYGRLLMEQAERIATREHRSAKLAVISGVGTRHYYRKLGYHLEGPYMVKHLPAAPSRMTRKPRAQPA